ncbi:MAG: peptidoglycan bridge formation glycyltransferase FemA/FemB family protein [Chloroflexi bacterium]|nr:peptidoglycan bridge formation glycyltransferase FemA/FemB family protein [Chloroflexota bacterium]
MVYETKKIDNVTDWTHLICQFSNPHILQSWQWGEQKQLFGWQMLPLAWISAGGTPRAAAMILKRRPAFGKFRLPVSLLYSPRGPLLTWNDKNLCKDVLSQLERLARTERAISIKIDPEVILGTGIPGTAEATQNIAGEDLQSQLIERGWSYSTAQVQFRNTVFLDLSGSEEDWLARMKQKTRYNLRLAERKGITIREGGAEDIQLVYDMYVETSLRDGFVIRSEEYYRSLWSRFIQAGLADILIAEYEGEPISGLILFHFENKAWYFYGMSTGKHNEKMPNYLIQWRAMQKAKAMHCTLYDLWGAPETFDETDGMWGVYRFKEGFGGKVIRTLGAWDYAPYKSLNTLFTIILPRLMNALRRRRLQQERHEAL